jgi:hypothetical protein
MGKRVKGIVEDQFRRARCDPRGSHGHMSELIEMVKHGRRSSVIDRKTQLSRRENHLAAQMLRRNKKAAGQGTKTQINF